MGGIDYPTGADNGYQGNYDSNGCYKWFTTKYGETRYDPPAGGGWTIYMTNHFGTGVIWEKTFCPGDPEYISP